MDLVFVVGGSNDENFDISGHYKMCLSLADNIAEKYDIDRDKVRVALVTYGALSKMTFDLQDYSNKELLKNAFLKAEYPGAGTETAQALDMVKSSVLPTGREGHVAKVVVLITAGVSQDKAPEIAQQLKDIGVEIYTVGIGPEVDRRQLEAIASDPKEDHVFVTAFEDAPSVAGPLSYTLSKGITILDAKFAKVSSLYSPSNSYKRFQISLFLTTRNGEQLMINTKSNFLKMYQNCTIPRRVSIYNVCKQQPTKKMRNFQLCSSTS